MWIRRCILLGMSFFLITACERSEEQKERDAAVLESNSPVNFGESLYVRVREHNSGFEYELTLPDGTVTNSSSFSTSKAKFSDAGFYSLKATKYDGTVISKVYITEVRPARINCSPEVNSLIWPSRYNLKFNEIVQGTSGANYVVRAKSPFGQLTVVFDHPEKPFSSSTYSTSFGFNDLRQGKAVAYVSNSLGAVEGFMDGDQFVHIRKEGDNMVLTLCELKPSPAGPSDKILARVEF